MLLGVKIRYWVRFGGLRNRLSWAAGRCQIADQGFDLSGELGQGGVAVFGDTANQGRTDDSAHPRAALVKDLADMFGGGDAEADANGKRGGKAAQGSHVRGDVGRQVFALTGDAGDGKIVDESVAELGDGGAAVRRRGGRDEEAVLQRPAARMAATTAGASSRGTSGENHAIDAGGAAGRGEDVGAFLENDGKGNHGDYGQAQAGGAGLGDGI